MADARIWVFDVEHGSCAFVRAPNGNTLMIDCGRAQFFSPIVYIRQHETTPYGPSVQFPLTKLLVSHPHDDHIEDIQRVIQYFQPRVLRRSTYDWNEVEGQSGGDYENLHLYVPFQATYNTPTTEPDWGPSMSVTYWCLSPNNAKAINDAKFINNSSWVAIVEIATFKIVFPGDLEKDGWLALLTNNEFRNTLHGASVFVASHHGHSSGYLPAIFSIMGKPWFNIISCHHKDDNVDPAYASADYARGVLYNDIKRYSFTTRTDGSCRINVSEDGNWNYRFYALPENLD
jgi:beta-lactamase superfamily II metal-dependent hydrolase